LTCIHANPFLARKPSMRRCMHDLKRLIDEAQGTEVGGTDARKDSR